MNKLLTILSVCSCSVAITSVLHGELLDLEKDELEFGFIKLTDCA